jgi:hypothetical protein
VLAQMPFCILQRICNGKWMTCNVQVIFCQYHSAFLIRGSIIKNNSHMFSCFRYWLVKNPLALYESGQSKMP